MARARHDADTAQGAQSFWLDPASTLVVVIDPQVGFCDPSGTLGRHFGVDDLIPVQATTRRLGRFLEQLPLEVAVLLTISEYPIGLHTNGNPEGDLATLCVPGLTSDCDLVDAISPKEHWARTIKHQVDAWASPGFRRFVEGMIGDGRSCIVVTGFMATTCVRETVLSMLGAVQLQDVSVLLPIDLIGARANSLRPDGAKSSRVSCSLEAMAAAGARVILRAQALQWLPR